MTPDLAQDPPSAAFFDFDRTLFDGDAGVLFGAELLRIRWRRVLDQGRGTLGWLVRVIGFVAAFLWLLTRSVVYRIANRLFLVKRSYIVRRAYATFRGWRLEELRQYARDYFDEVIAPRLYGDALREMEWHRREGRRVVVATTNMHELIHHVKRYAPVDDVIAIQFSAPSGVIDGHVRGPLWGEEKAKAVRDYAHERGLSLPRSHAYTDHHSDLRFLQLVGHPHVVNPDWRMRWAARRRRWPVHRWHHPKRKPN